MYEYYSISDIYDPIKIASGVVIALFAVYSIAAGAFSAWLAAKKGYDGGIWFLLGLIFGIVALMAVGLAPLKKPSEDSVAVRPPVPVKTDPLTSEYRERMERLKSAGNPDPAPIAKHSFSPPAMLNQMTDKELGEAVGASRAEELRKNKKLLDDGVLTQAEFDKKKAQILGL
jgi:hypothetical protein